MSEIIIGIDPDSRAHGVAVYRDGALIELNCIPLTGLLSFIYLEDASNVEVHIEDVNAVSAAFNARDRKTNINVKLKMAQHIGMCKQSQTELERLFEWMNVKVVKHKISKMWKKDKAQFEKVTGWKGRSNEDTRSAAWFGYMGLNKN
tara:strand:+ start:123 stop:563 length:441 start_codon:yes stop_codon:yes gene_type:complete